MWKPITQLDAFDLFDNLPQFSHYEKEYILSRVFGLERTSMLALVTDPRVQIWTQILTVDKLPKREISLVIRHNIVFPTSYYPLSDSIPGSDLFQPLASFKGLRKITESLFVLNVTTTVRLPLKAWSNTEKRDTIIGTVMDDSTNKLMPRFNEFLKVLTPVFSFFPIEENEL